MLWIHSCGLPYDVEYPYWSVSHAEAELNAEIQVRQQFGETTKTRLMVIN